MLTSASDTPAEEPREQLARGLAFVWRARHHWPAILVVILATAIGYAVFVHFRPPLYRSEAVVVYTDAARLGDDPARPAAARSVALRAQEMLTARTVLQRVVEEFDLYAQIRREHGLVDAVDELKKHIVLKAPGGDTFTITFDGRTAVEAQRVTARLVELLIDQDFSLRNKEAKSSATFLAIEKQRAEKELNKVEQELAEFMTLHPRFALDATPLATGAAIRAMGAGGVHPQAGPLRASGTSRRALLPVAAAQDTKTDDAPATGPPPDPERARLSAADRARAEASVAAASADLADKQLRFTEAHPDVRAARDALAQARARRAGLGPAPVPIAAPVVSAAPVTASPPARRFAARAEPPRGATTGAEKAAPDLVVLETDWSRLTRAVIEARQRHDQVEAGLFKAQIAASSMKDSSSAQMTVIDPAFLPLRPMPPGERTLAAGFGVIGLVLGCLAALGLAAVDDRIYGRRGAAGLGQILCEVPRRRRRRRK